MTDRIHSLTVVLERNNRDDDTQPLIDAILMFHGVLSVTTHVANVDSHMAEERARRALTEKIYAALKEPIE